MPPLLLRIFILLSSTFVTAQILEPNSLLEGQSQHGNENKDTDSQTQGFIGNKCNKINLVENTSGQIRSPSIRGIRDDAFSYPGNISCAWYIKTNADFVLTLSFSLFDLEEDKHLGCSQNNKPCCGNTWLSLLSIPPEPGSVSAVPLNKAQDSVNIVYCGRSLSLPPLIFSGAGLLITFKTGDAIIGGQGFVLDYFMDKPVRKQCDDGQYHCSNGKCIMKSWLCNQWDECGDSSDEKNCTVSCKTGYSHCSSNSSHCYDFIRGRCDGVLDCPGGEDEQACALSCGDELPCRRSHGRRSGCYKPSQRCDSIRDCPDGSDEEGCDAFLCGPHRNGGFLCRNRRCIPYLNRCDGVQDCGDFSDEEICMKMSVITAVILGSLICGLLLIIAAGCGLRLFRLRTALERRWSTIRLQQTRSMHQDFDEFGLRRPVMGRLPPPSYAQAVGAVHLDSSAGPISVVGSRPVHLHSLGHRRHSNRPPRRPAPPLPDPPALAPLRSLGSSASNSPESPVQDLLEESPSPSSVSVEAVEVESVEQQPHQSGETSVSTGIWARIFHQWRKQVQRSNRQPEVTATAPLQESPLLVDRCTGDEVDTEPLLIESHNP